MADRAVMGRGWAYVGATIGGIVSVAANVEDAAIRGVEPGGLALAALWPVALLVAVEILARTAWPSGGRWVALRWAGVVPVAGVAAIVSYGHLSGLLAHYGESRVTAGLGPLAIDGLMLTASGALVAGSPQAGSSEVSAPLTVPAAAETPRPRDAAPMLPAPVYRPEKIEQGGQVQPTRTVAPMPQANAPAPPQRLAAVPAEITEAEMVRAARAVAGGMSVREVMGRWGGSKARAMRVARASKEGVA